MLLYVDVQSYQVSRDCFWLLCAQFLNLCVSQYYILLYSTAFQIQETGLTICLLAEDIAIDDNWDLIEALVTASPLKLCGALFVQLMCQ